MPKLHFSLYLLFCLLFNLPAPGLVAAELALTSDETAFLAAHPSIRVSSEQHWAPYDFIDNGVSTGYSVDYLQLLASKVGLELEFVQSADWRKLTEAFCARRIDLIQAIDRFSLDLDCGIPIEPPMIREAVQFATRTNFKPVERLEDLFGLRVALYFDTETTRWFLDAYGERVTPVFIRSPQEGLRAVAENRADVMPEFGSVLGYYVNHEGFSGLKIEGYLEEIGLLDILFAARGDWPLLASILAKAQQAIRPSELAALRERWLKAPPVSTARISGVELTADERAFLLTHPRIRVQNEQDYPPYDFVDNGQPAGFSIDYLRLIAARTGLEFEFISSLSWAELLARARAGEIDVLHSLLETPTRREFLAFTRAYVKDYLALVVPAGSLIQNFDDLRGKRVSVLKGGAAASAIAREHPEVELVAYASTRALLKAVVYGEVAAGLISQAVGTYIAEQELLPALEYRHLDALDRTARPWHIGVRKDWPELLSIIEKGMDAIPYMEVAELRQRWLTHNSHPPQTLILSPAERRYLTQKGRLRLCIDPDWMPFDAIDADGHEIGMGSDYRALFSSLLKIPIELVPTRTWVGSLRKAKARDCDIVALATPTPNRAHYLDFTQPLVRVPYVIAIADRRLFIEDFDRVADQRFAVVRGYAVIEDLRARYPGIELVEFPMIEQALRAVLAGEVDGYIGLTAAIGFAIQRYGLVDLRIGGRLPLDSQLTMGVRNDEPLLRDIFNKAITEIGPRERDRIYRKWAAVTQERVLDRRLLAQILIAVALLLGLFIFWNRRMARAKRETDVALEQLAQAKREIETQNARLEQLSTTDTLTGLPNRLKLDAELAREFARAERYGAPLAVILLDIDHFKEINDGHGHLVGDQVLIAFARLLQARQRATDRAGRWGGEEFLILCPYTNASGALSLAEELRRDIAGHQFAEIPGSITASFGVASYRPGDTAVSLIGRSDTALYRAKAAGRNRVIELDDEASTRLD
ncbi:transporter substrate-binding domain-containing protein [Rhabdochromatium marinum]|uniref:transporter substrate-binding domain-containing diguanylate cyclase n=1 Tax=Rhabdochromatium marinum TaxID=48729 RepID=UPI0019046E46|nr:transporter substrate-binding domain-containing protein [Rhabdochromatium marinum]